MEATGHFVDTRIFPTHLWSEKNFSNHHSSRRFDDDIVITNIRGVHATQKQLHNYTT